MPANSPAIGCTRALLALMLCGCLSRLAPAADAPRSIAGVWWNHAPGSVLRPLDGAAVPWVAGITPLAPESPAGEGPPGATDIKQRCAPIGVPRVWLQPYPFQIIEQPGVIAIVYEHRQSYRLIYMDQSLPARDSLDPWFFGHSVGHWEADTLVVRSTGYNADTRLDEVLPHSELLAITERFSKIDRGRTLELRMTIDDPKTFARPWTVRLTFSNQPRERIAEYVCGIGVFSTRNDP